MQLLADVFFRVPPESGGNESCLEVILYHQVGAVGVVLQTVHVLARAIKVFTGKLEARGDVPEDVTEDILTLAVFILGIEAVALGHRHGRVTAGDVELARHQVDLGGSLPAVHRGGLDPFVVAGVGREVEARTGQILNVRRDALSVNAVEEEVEGFPDADVTAALNAPAEVGGVVARARVVHINIAEHGGCADVARPVASPRQLQINREVGHALRNRREVGTVGAAHVGKLGRHTHLEDVLPYRELVADHRGEVEVIGIGTLEVNGLRSGQQVAESGYVASEGKPAQRDVSRTHTRRIAVLRTAAEIGVDEYDDAAELVGIGHRLEVNTRRGGVHHQLLTVGIGLLHRDVVGYEVDVIDTSVEVITGAKIDVTAHRERELVVLGREDELGLLDLLETEPVRIAVVLNGTLDRQTVQRRSLHCGIATLICIYGVGLMHGNQIDRRRVLALLRIACAGVALG